MRLVAVLLALGILTSFAQTKHCTSQPVPESALRALLQVLPDVATAKQAGGKISVMPWNPGSEYRIDVFFFYMVSTSSSGPPVLLDNGLIGYFGINKKTGEVYEFVTQEPVTAKALTNLQRQLRTKYCISDQAISNGRKIGLEK